MLILKKLPQGAIYPQITQAPITTYAAFLNFFRGGHTIDDNVDGRPIDSTLAVAMLKIGVASRHLTKLKNMSIPDEALADISLTKSGSQLIQTTLDQEFCELAIAEARKSIPEGDGKPHPHVGVVIVKNGNVLATGFRGESGKGDHGEYCALKKLNEVDLQSSTVYTTLEPCSTRTPPKKPCTERLIASKVARVVYGMADKHESVYGHPSLVEAGIEIGFFPHDLMQELLDLNREWSDSLRIKPIVPPNDTPPLASVSYYKLGTSMADNTHFFVRPPWTDGGFFTVEDAPKNVLAYGRTIEEIAVEWHKIHVQKVHVEKLVRQNTYSSSQLLNLS
jgi:pyrimidine deaminase RibD-like protein